MKNSPKKVAQGYISRFEKTELEDWPGENLEGLNERAEVAAFFYKENP